METAIEKINALIGQADRIKKGFESLAYYAKDKHTHDKVGAGFNLESRFNACEGLNVRVVSWHGTYGDSSCSTIFDFQKEIFNTHLENVLQSKFREIMLEVEVSIRDEAKALKETAEKELTEELKKVQEL